MSHQHTSSLIPVTIVTFHYSRERYQYECMFLQAGHTSTLAQCMDTPPPMVSIRPLFLASRAHQYISAVHDPPMVYTSTLAQYMDTPSHPIVSSCLLDGPLSPLSFLLGACIGILMLDSLLDGGCLCLGLADGITLFLLSKGNASTNQLRGTSGLVLKDSTL
jgi:hypothetical protein